MDAGHDELRDPMQYDIMREALNRYRGRCIALRRSATSPQDRETWTERQREALRRANQVNPNSRSAVAKMTAELHQLYTELPAPSATLASA